MMHKCRALEATHCFLETPKIGTVVGIVPALALIPLIFVAQSLDFFLILTAFIFTFASNIIDGFVLLNDDALILRHTRNVLFFWCTTCKTLTYMIDLAILLSWIPRDPVILIILFFVSILNFALSVKSEDLKDTHLPWLCGCPHD